MKHALILLIALGTIFISPSVAVRSQTDCSAQIQAIITALPGVCADLAVGETCLAHEDVSLTSLDSAASFVRAGDRASLSRSQTLHSSAYDPVSEAWGVALLGRGGT
jgi:hypothetical protein